MLKPLDLQTVMPRSVDLQRMQQIDHSRPVVQQQEEIRDNIKQSQLRQEIVQTSEALADSNRIHEHDGERRRGHNRRYSRYNNKKEKEMTAEDEQLNGENRGQHIDIKM